MKQLMLLILLSTTLLFSYDIHLRVAGTKSSHGKMYIGLYNKSRGFTKVSRTYKKIITKASKGSRSYTFRNVPKGIYALSVFHDENSNGKLDKNLFGVPKEGYGFSNNRRFALRASTFKEASFALNKNKNITIKLGY